MSHIKRVFNFEGKKPSTSSQKIRTLNELTTLSSITPNSFKHDVFEPVESTNFVHMNDKSIIPSLTSGKLFQEKVLSELKKLNEDPDVLYSSQLSKLKDPKQINLSNDAVKNLGFLKPSPQEYVYNGDDPASALRGLLNIRPLVLDCGTSLHLLTYQTLLELLGKENFNSYIKNVYNNVLSINKTIPPQLPANRVAYYTSVNEKHENPLPKELKKGDHLWIQGPADGYAFHPTREENAFNVLVDKNDSENLSLIGFVSTSSSMYGKWSYEGLQNFLLESYNSPLTLGDIRFILANRKNNKEPAPYSRLTYEDAYQWLEKHQPVQLAEALKLLFRKKVDLKQETTLYPPKSASIRGVLQHNSLPDGQLLLIKESQLSTVAFNPVLPEEKQFSYLIPGFKTDLPHQKQIHAATDDFYALCIDENGQRKIDQDFHGLILYGNAGTGKTMACNALIDRLEKKDHIVWKTDFSEGETLLSLKERQELLLLLQTKGSQAYYAALTDKLRPIWERVDVIFIDDTNNRYDVLADVSKVAVDYARKTGKKILITCNSDPINAFHSHIKYPVDAITIRHINGPDYRKEKAWYQNVQPHRYHEPEKINTFFPTKNQQEMQQWLKALQAHPGNNGIAFYGAPGLGKTTALKAWFSSQGLQSVSIESHKLIDDVDLKNKLALSESEYLVIDDCNDPKGNFKYQKILFDLLNNETFLNKNGQPVRVILVSNRASDKELINDTISGNELLTPRMKSRYAGRFVSINLSSGEDLRANGVKSGVIVKADETSILPEAYRLSIPDYVTELQERFNKFDVYSRQTFKNDGGNFTMRMQKSSAFQKAHDNAWKNYQNFQKEALKNIESSSVISIDMRGSNDYFNQYGFRWKTLMTQILDVMEAKPDYKVTIVSDKPQETMDLLKKIMGGIDGTDKYVSRLQRFEVE